MYLVLGYGTTDLPQYSETKKARVICPHMFSDFTFCFVGVMCVHVLRYGCVYIHIYLRMNMRCATNPTFSSAFLCCFCSRLEKGSGAYDAFC